ncbi:Fe-S cluster assembly protein SufD [Zafaria sp. J156]|uniref:Fe-S cluster assembly protein SufD n=1 Tax=Zafaria sp. J156 TaxID=3116490 RepID=UPI002E7A5995|nr:Fe-S cluster assembly protein SufD [Zafaria sp. J156]MEE1620214.1 Fe-S cluster assembly protein SufD [Zafaria sp. J156]
MTETATTTEKARIGAPSIDGMTEEGEVLVADKVVGAHSHGGGSETQIMHSRAERPTSHDVADFAVPNGREEEWRFSPVKALRGLFADDAGEAGAVELSVTAPEGAVSGVLRAGEAPRGTVLVPADRAAVVASANAAEAVHVRIPAGSAPEGPVVVDIAGRAGGSRANSHLVIEAEEDSRAVVVIEHTGAADFNGNVEILVGDRAELVVVTVQRWDDEAVHTGQHDAVVGHGASFKHIAVTFGGRIVRLNANVRFAGEQATADLFGMYFADAGQHLEHRSFVDHNTPRNTSNVLYKGALQGAGARTVWVGDVLIRKEAVGTDSYEANRNLVLTDGARADSVPNLEIETGLIEGAGHASTTGRFDDEHLFYLMARGIDEKTARRLVVRGFLNEIVQQIPSEELQARLTDDIEAELAASAN